MNKQINNKFLVRLQLIFIVTIILLLPSRAFGAGTVLFSAESSSSVEVGSTVTVNFYVSPSSANIYSGEFKAVLSNLSLVSYSPSSSPFTGLNSIVVGNSAGSTNFTVAFSYTGAVPGSSSKALVGRAVLKASSSAGTAQVQLSDIIADDNNGDPMATTSSGKTLSVIAIATSTPPPSSVADTGSSGGGAAPDSSPNTSNPVSSPNPNSEAIIPVVSNDESVVVSEDEASIAISEIEENTTSNEDVPESSENSKAVLYTIGLITSVVLTALLYFVVRWIRNRRGSEMNYKPSVEPREPIAPPENQTPLIGSEPRVFKPTIQDSNVPSQPEEINTENIDQKL